MNQRSRALAGVGVAFVVVVVLVSCLAGTNPTTSDTSAASSTAPVVSTTHNAADMEFATMMAVHHQGAMDMSALAGDRADSDDVKTLALQIQEEQGPEITQMKNWLTVWHQAMSGASGMPSATVSSMSSMPGMDMSSSAMPSMSGMSMPASSAMPSMSGMSMPSTSSSAMEMPGMTAKDMAALKAAKGKSFDRLFLKLMIVHHQAGIDMAKTELVGGTNPQAISLAADIVSSQNTEITKMQKMLTALG